MINLTLQYPKEKIIKPFANDYEDMNTEGMLKSLFLCECSAREGVHDEENHQDYIVLNNEIEFPKSYVPIVKAEWAFAKSGFEEYVQDWMNTRGIMDVFKFLNAKYPAKWGGLFLPLVVEEHAILTLIKYSEDIESIIDNMADGMGLEFWYVFFETKRINGELRTGASKFKLKTLPLIAFEETVRRVIQDLEIGW